MAALQKVTFCRRCIFKTQRTQLRTLPIKDQDSSKKCYSTGLSPSIVLTNETKQDNTLYFRDLYSLPRPNHLDPRGTTVFMFPGQGSQRIGMVDSLLRYPKAVGLFKAAEEIMNENMIKICSKGPQEKLNQTVLSQVALYVTSLAFIERLKIEQPMAVENCVGAIGFSVGEIAALVFAGSISFEEGLTLARGFGECMQLASQEEDGGMLTLLFEQGAAMAQCRVKAEEYCTTVLKMENPVCTVAIHLFPSCQVVAGSIEALKFIEKNASKFGIKHLKRLAVSGAFHSPLMYYTSKKWVEYLDRVTFNVPLIPVYSGVDTKQLEKQQMIYSNLRRLPYSCVKWFQLLSLLYKNPPRGPFPRPYICEPSQTLRAFLKESNPQAAETCYYVSS